MQHGAAAHEEKALVEDVREGVGAGAVDGELRAEADAGHHVADLRDDVVGEQPAAVVFQHGVHDAVQRHDHAHRHEDFQAGHAADERVNGGLGREGAEEDGAVEGRLAVGVGQPRMKRRHGGVEQEAGGDQIRGKRRVGDVERHESERAGGLVVQHDAGEQRDTAGHVDEQVAIAGTERALASAEPDEERRGQRHEFPEEEEREEIAGVDGAERAGDVRPGSDVLGGAFHVQAVERADDRHQAHDVAEDLAEAVHAAEGQRPVEEADFAKGAVRHREHACKRGDGDEQQPALAQALGDERGDQGADQHDQRGVKPEIIHGRNPPAS
ncbi:MAG: hypothetical protein BWX86_00572 [Verrucomicrobia bacterium ADurb.Bin122]|nr:MAG: hypothetical protein BWX86_00572 [Verrucomicrobia bacterium ADurb.Bin122]